MSCRIFGPRSDCGKIRDSRGERKWKYRFRVVFGIEPGANEPRKVRKHTFAQSLPPRAFVNWRAIAIFYCADHVLGLQKGVNYTRYLGQFGFEEL